MPRVIKLEIEVKASENFEYDSDRELADHAASCFIGSDFEHVEIKYEGKEL